MYDAQRPYVDLWHDLLGSGDDDLRDQIIAPWLDRVDCERRWLRELRTALQDPPVALTALDAARLYALSRCLDVIITRLTQTPSSAQIADYILLLVGLGLEAKTPLLFNPFDCEIHRVTQTPDPGRPPMLRHVHWPAACLGPLLVQRAGVTVRSGRDHIDKDVAETSILFWASQRNRPRADLSDGWGRNSQWDTRPRQDYAMADRFYYNVSAGRPPQRDAMEGLGASHQSEIIRHRCLVTAAQHTPDLWPYDHSLIEKRTA